MIMEFIPETLWSVAQCDGTNKPLLETLYVKVHVGSLHNGGTINFKYDIIWYDKFTLIIIITARCMSSVCLSVCPSVTLLDQDHIGWKSWHLIARKLAEHLRSSTYSQGYMGKFRGGQRWGGKKWRAGAEKRQYLWNA